MKRAFLKIRIYSFLKILLCAALLFFLSGLLSTGKESSTSIEDMTAKVIAKADLSRVQLADNQMIRRLYGLDPAGFDGITLYYPVSNMDAEEIFIIKLSSISQQDSVKDAIEARLATQLASFDGYGVDQYETLENSIILVEGNYILWVSGYDTAPIVAAFKEGL